MKSDESKTEDRLSIRANASQKATLRKAAEARHMNVSQFVLQTSLDAAAEVLSAQSRIVIPADQFEWLMNRLDEPTQDLPELRRLLNEQTTWNG